VTLNPNVIDADKKSKFIEKFCHLLSGEHTY
jgi:hypothetical protein